MSRKRNGANIGGAAVSETPERSQNKFLDTFEPLGIAEAEILVADPLAAGEQRICELQRVEIEVAVQCLEPFGRVARRVLQFEHFERAFGLILVERLRQGKVGPVENFGELDRILERELGPRADREMGGVRGVAEQDQFVVRPALAFDPLELEPRRAAAQVRGIGHQALSLEIFGENPLARGDRIGLAQRVEGESAPGRVRAFDDEGRAIGREFISMRPDPPGLGLLERKGEGVERLGRAEPGEAVGAGFGINSEKPGIMVAKAAVDAVGANDEVVFGPMLEARFAFPFEVKFDAQFPGALAEDREQPLAADADKTVPGGAYRVAVNMDLDIVPMGEFVRDDLRRRGVVGGEILDRLVREDDAPAERFALAIALKHFDVMRRVAQLHRDREIEPGGTAADHCNFHEGWLSRAVRATQSRRPVSLRPSHRVRGWPRSIEPPWLRVTTRSSSKFSARALSAT